MSGKDAGHMGSDASNAGNAEQAEIQARLIARCREGDLQAFDKLVALHRERVFAMLVAMVRNRDDAWDIAQDGFVKAWRSIRSFKGDCTFFTWLFRIMRNQAIDHLRKRNRRSESALDDDRQAESSPNASAHFSPKSESPDEMAWQAEIGQRIDMALDHLSAEHREVIVLREIHGMAYEEIARVAGCSTGTVMSRLFYARKNLQNLLADIYNQL